MYKAYSVHISLIQSHLKNHLDLPGPLEDGSFNPIDLLARTPILPSVTIMGLVDALHRMRLWPRRDAREQDFFQRPHMGSQSGRHCWCTRLPPLG
jgi:hypothetical protein